MPDHPDPSLSDLSDAGLADVLSSARLALDYDRCAAVRYEQALRAMRKPPGPHGGVCTYAVYRRGYDDGRRDAVATAGAAGGSVTSAAKAQAARDNGRRGGRPRKKN